MKPYPEAEQAYSLHTAHKEGDWRRRYYLGLAESVEELLDIVTAEPPLHYCLIASCVDGSPTLRLNYREKTLRTGLKLLPREEIMRLLDELDAIPVERRDDRVNSLRRHDLRERTVNKIIRRGTALFDWWARRRQQQRAG